MKQLLNDLLEPKHVQTFYAAKIKNRVEGMARSWSYKLDPRHYQGLYIHKVYQESFASGNARESQRVSTSQLSFLEASNSPSMQSTETNSPQQLMDNDIVGLSVIEASPQYILKFNTLRQHLYIQEHPIVKILNLFRDSL